MRIVAPILLAIIVWPLPQASPAQGTEIRRITQTTATSECIGDGFDPLCTLETMLACRARQIKAFCDIAGWHMGPDRAHNLEYRIVSRERFLNRGYPLMPDGQMATYPESVEFGVDERQCTPGLPKCPNTEWERAYYLVGRGAGEWSIFAAGYKPFDE